MRGFVIGNGPSLSLMDLDLLRDEFTVGCNRFDLLNLDWSPTHWILADVRHEDGWWDWDDLLSRGSEYHFRWQDKRYIPEGPGIQFHPRCQHIGGTHVPLSWHLPTLCEYGGSIGWALQLAVLAGCDPIYVIGCDLYKYRGPDDPDINHFHPEYCPYKIRKSTGEEMIGPSDWARLNDRLVFTHKLAKQEAGVDIFYAGVGGMLDVYPRVDYKSLFT